MGTKGDDRLRKEIFMGADEQIKRLHKLYGAMKLTPPSFGTFKIESARAEKSLKELPFEKRVLNETCDKISTSTRVDKHTQVKFTRVTQTQSMSSEKGESNEDNEQPSQSIELTEEQKKELSKGVRPKDCTEISNLLWSDRRSDYGIEKLGKGRKSTVFVTQFTWEGFLRFLQEDRGSYLSRKSSHNTDSDQWDWFGSRSFENALNLFEDGWTEGQRNLEDRVENFDITDHIERDKNRFESFVGYAPNVPNFLAGNPVNMFNKNNQKKKPCIHLVFDYGASAANGGVDYTNFGYYMIQVAKIFEAQGVTTKLSIMPNFTLAQPHSEVRSMSLTLKDFGEAFLYKDIAFPLCHPSFFRRFCFKFLESYDSSINRNFNGGYGCPMSRCFKTADRRKLVRDIFGQEAVYVSGIDHFTSIEEFNLNTTDHKVIKNNIDIIMKEVKESIEFTNSL